MDKRTLVTYQNHSLFLWMVVPSIVKITRISSVFQSINLTSIFLQSGDVFVTSHGNSPCDGVGETVKRPVVVEFLHCCEDHIQAITLIHSHKAQGHFF